MFIELIDTLLIALTQSSSPLLENRSKEFDSFFVTDDPHVFRISANHFIRVIDAYDDATEKTTNNRSSEGAAYGSITAKGLTMGSASTSSTLNVGRSAMFGGTIENKSAFKFVLPDLDLDYYRIESASFRVSRINGALSSMYCYSFANPSYEDLTGLSNPSLSFVDTSTISSSVFEFNVSSIIADVYENQQTSLSVLLEGHDNNKVATLGNPNSTNRPRLYIEYSNYGSASAYEFPTNPYYASGNLGSINCMKYALGFSYTPEGNYNILPDLQSIIDDTAITRSVLEDAISEIFQSRGYTFRILPAYDSLIATNERRIAFRVSLVDGDHPHLGNDFHFMKQCSNGDWAWKVGPSGPFAYAVGEDAVLSDSTWRFVYTSPTVYIAFVD